MTLFWIICAVLLTGAILVVALPLWRGISKNNNVERDTANLEILRDQIAEMDVDLKNGLLTPELYEQGKRELQARLLEEVSDPKVRETFSQSRPLKIIAIVLVVLLPLASISLYMKVGNLSALLPEAGHVAVAHTEEELKILEEKAAQKPDDANLQIILARSYDGLGHFSDSSKIYESLSKLFPNEAMVWADYADALGMMHGSLQGEPTKLLERALQVDPNHPKALWLAGSAALERKDYVGAVGYLQRLRTQLPATGDDTKMVEETIRQIKQQLAQSNGGKLPAGLEEINRPAAKAKAAGKERLTGTVSLGDALKGKADPNDTLFVLARAVEGPKMPLAILRLQVKDLPVNFTLDDSLAMSPAMKLSNFDRVIVVARISKSGNAMSQSGDMQGMSKPLAVGTTGIKIEIDQLVP